MRTGEHLLVQAGTGTGKSLGYLVPALLHDRRVVVATATLALQHQLVERDIPALLEAVSHDAGVLRSRAGEPSYAVLKGRSNYACLHRVREGVPDDQGALVELPAGSMGSEVLALRTWAEQQAEVSGPGDRDSAPKHTDKVWRQVSVNHRECLGATRCPFATECFAERAKEKAARSRLVVTNHSLLAIDAIEGVPMIPEYDVVVIDEAHELSARVTQAATDELSVPEVERAARRAQRHVEGTEADDLADAAEALRAAFDDCGAGRHRHRPDRPVRRAGAGPRRRAGAAVGLPEGVVGRTGRPGPDAGPRRRPGAVQERRADGGQRRLRRALAGRARAVPRRRPALRRAAAGVGSAARQAADREDRRADQRHPHAGRRLLERGRLAGTQAGRAGDPRRRPSPPGRPRRASCPGGASTSARPSTTPGRRSSTSPGTCRRPGATACCRPTSTRSSTSSTPPAGARWACSRAAGPRRRRPRRPASDCRT